MTVRDKKIEWLVYQFLERLDGGRLSIKKRKELDDYYRKTLKEIIYSKDNEIGDLKERLSLMINTTRNIKINIENLLSNDKKYVK
jgi:hypothetical protein